MAKPKIATTSLAGCFGCHMSLLDIDERILKLIELVDFDKSPIDDIKKFTGPLRGRPDRGRLLQRGERPRAAGVPQALRHAGLGRRLRDHGRHPGAAQHHPAPGVPRRGLPATARRSTTPRGTIPNDPELPLLLDKVYPCHEVVKIDYYLPGCPPSADTIWAALTALLSNASRSTCPTS